MTKTTCHNSQKTNQHYHFIKLFIFLANINFCPATLAAKLEQQICFERAILLLGSVHFFFGQISTLKPIGSEMIISFLKKGIEKKRQRAVGQT